MDAAEFTRLRKRIAAVLVRSPYSEEPFHSENTLEWVLRLRPDADSALQAAALGHDIERADPYRRVYAAGYATYELFKDAHAINSAEILSELMEELDLDPVFVRDTARLVAAHETGGDDREDALKNADTLSFFQVCLPLYFDRHGAEVTRRRMVWGFRKLPPSLREHVLGMEYPDPALRALIGESLRG